MLGTFGVGFGATLLTPVRMLAALPWFEAQIPLHAGASDVVWNDCIALLQKLP